MRRKALTMAILIGTLTLAGAAEVRATPAFSATIVIEDGAVRKVTGDHFRSRHVFQHSRRFHPRFDRQRFDRHGFDRHRSFDRHKSFDRQRFDRHKGFARPHHFSKRHFRGQAHGVRVIVRPAFGRSLHRHLPAQPLIRNGSFARRSFHWHLHRR